MLGPGGMYLPLLANGLLRDMPALIWIDYVAGMNPVPYDLIEAIGKNAAIKILHVLSDAIQPGIVSTNLVADGLTETMTLARSIGGLELFGARIAVYQKELTEFLATARRYYGGVVYRPI